MSSAVRDLQKGMGRRAIEVVTNRLRGVGVLSSGAPNGSNRWNVNFSDGTSNNNNCDNDNAARLVRRGLRKPGRGCSLTGSSCSQQLDNGSCVSRAAPAQFCERVGVRLPRATHLMIVDTDPERCA